MSLFILHEDEVIIDDWRHAAEDLTAAWAAHFEEQQRIWQEMVLDPLHEIVRTFVREFAHRWLAQLRRREERRNLKRRRAARARCGYR